MFISYKQIISLLGLHHREIRKNVGIALSIKIVTIVINYYRKKLEYETPIMVECTESSIMLPLKSNS